MVAGLLSLTNCKVNPEFTDVYVEDVAWSSKANLELSLNKFYPLIGGTYYSDAVNDDAYSDILKSNTSGDNINLFVTGASVMSPGANPFDKWEWGYQWIAKCNEFLDGLKKHGGKLPADVTTRAEAEVRFFRAYVNFELAKRYGASIILFKELPKENYYPRSTPDEVWDFIASDLDFAAQNLPITPEAGKKGKLTKGGAFGLKARAMLYAKRWKASSDAVVSLNNLGLYDLYPDYAELFNQRRSKDKDNKESIVEFGFMPPNFGYSFDKFYAPPGDQGYAQLSPTENLVNEYQMADGSKFDWYNPAMGSNPYANREPRFYASILYNGAPWKGRTVETYVGGKDGFAFGGSTTSTGYYMRKLLDGSKKTQDDGFQPGELTFYFMRYAEVLLIYAEAMAEQGNLGEALTALNKVRARAGVPAVTAGSRDEFMPLLRHERMVELAFEGHRFWDLRRWGLAGTVLNGTNVFGIKITKKTDGTFSYAAVDSDDGKKRFYPEKYNRFPIPVLELQRNPKMEQFAEWK